MGLPPHGRASPDRSRLATLAGLALVYFVAGKLGLSLAFVNANASAVWPPTGIALAALLLLGSRVWPAIFVGAFLVNVTTAGTVLTSLGIAAGNTLESLVGAALVRRFAGGPRAFERPRGVFSFAAVAGLGSPMLAATCGVTSLWLGGFASSSDYGTIWLTWWLGDAGGGLVVAPLLLLWAASPPPRLNGKRALEAGLLAVTLGAVALVVFGGRSVATRSLSFLALPPLLWAALRFSQRTAATALALLSGVAVWGCLRGAGPFATANESLVVLQAFMVLSSVTTLSVAAMVRQRRQAEDALLRAAAIVDFSEDAIMGKALDGTVLSWNRGAERLYGYPAANMIGRNVSILAPPERPDEMPGILERVGRGEPVEHTETVRVRRDGSRVAVSLTVSPIRDRRGTVVGASAIARDITLRKRSEERFATQFAVTRALAESATLREAAGRLLPALCEGLGWEAGAVWKTSDRPRTGRLEAVWPDPAAGGSVSLRTRDQIVLVGWSLADRARESGRQVWIPDLAHDRDDDPVGEDEFRGALAWPLKLGGEVAAVLVLLSRSPRAPRQELLDLMTDIATRIGQFLEREHALAGLTRLQKAVETLQMGVTIADMGGSILYANPAEAAMHGYRPEELVGRHVSVFMPPGWTPAGGRPAEIRTWRRETVNQRRDGSVFPVQLLSDAVRDTDGAPVAVVTCTEEITERKRAEEALRSSEERYRLLFERNLAGVYRATLDGRLLECNEAFARILGYSSPREILSRSVWDLFFSRQEREAQVALLRDKRSLTSVERRLRRRDGSAVWVLENETLLPGGEALVEGTLIDISDRKEFEERIEHQAYHDALTGLPNRAALDERLQSLLAQAHRTGRGLGVLFLDLDGFKEINDSVGHSSGDRLLQQVAGRLRECVREDDLVSRVGGDEFVLVLPRVARGSATRVATKILARMRTPFHLDDHQLTVTTSIGISLFPDDGDDGATLLKNADAAMYRAKELGRNACQRWDPTLRPRGRRLELQARLRRAIERGELEVFYQPQVELATGRVVGAEALLRWRDPERGMVPPGDFIPVAEESGMIVPLGEWVLRRACGAARRWHDHGLRGLRIAVNLSGRQFQQPGLGRMVRAVLEETGLPPDTLELEITETLAMQSFDLTVPVLRDLVSIGVGVSIDDLGTGYSSLVYLKLLPIRRLKIDRLFVVGIAREPQDRAIVGGIVRMAHGLGLSVLAEGVEGEEQLHALKELRCDEGQGHVFGAAMSQEAFEHLAGMRAPDPLATARAPRARVRR